MSFVAIRRVKKSGRSRRKRAEPTPRISGVINPPENGTSKLNPARCDGYFRPRAAICFDDRSERFVSTHVFWCRNNNFILKVILGCVVLIGATGCVHYPPAASPAQITSLQQALLRLGTDVTESDAKIVAALAYDYPRDLARTYRLVRPPLWHNLLINLRLKKRGLCYQWAEDLGAKLISVRPASLEFHWGVAQEGKMWEHNTVVVTARHQAFDAGLFLDPWRRSGSLVWGTVAHDSYAWREGRWLSLESSNQDSLPSPAAGAEPWKP